MKSPNKSQKSTKDIIRILFDQHQRILELELTLEKRTLERDTARKQAILSYEVADARDNAHAATLDRINEYKAFIVRSYHGKTILSYRKGD